MEMTWVFSKELIGSAYQCTLLYSFNNKIFFINRLNSTITINTYHDQLHSKNALDIVSKYDVIVDATDNVPTR